MQHLTPMEARDRKISIAETKRHLKIIRLLKEERQKKEENETKQL